MREHLAIDERLVARIKRLATLGDVERTPKGASVRLAVPLPSGLVLASEASTIEVVVDAIEAQVEALRAQIPADRLAAYDATILPETV